MTRYNEAFWIRSYNCNKKGNNRKARKIQIRSLVSFCTNINFYHDYVRFYLCGKLCEGPKGTFWTIFVTSL